MYDRFDPAGFRGSPFEAGRIAMNDGAEVEGDAPGDQSGIAVARGAGGAACTRWRVLALCEIANFQSLRRHLGRPRADTLIHDLADRMSDLEAGVRSVTAGRSLIELGFEAESPVAARALVERLAQFFARSVDLDGERHLIQLVWGIAVAPFGDDDEVRLTEGAEAALEQARTDAGIVSIDLSQAHAAFDGAALVRELPRAIAAGQLFLQYQPKVNVRREMVTGAEALVRWHHPVRGLILPGEFINAAEDGGEIVGLTLWTLRQVIADQQVLAAHGHDMPVFINISGVLLADDAFVAEACRIITESGAKIGFEITETAVIRDPDSAIRHLQTFAGIGIPLAIDDYGAGLSSLAYLKQLPATELKIDKMFVMQLTSSNRDPLIVRSTIDLAHALEMEVTAEGVETPAALALLSVMGCDMVQGYLISRPIALDAFVRYLDEEGFKSVATMRPSFGRAENFWRKSG
ncbi:GGDEF domain-containing phosphodiesterase [Sphingomonas sp. R647]|uniref:GGDEF domain-containing phosphodiesterase n=1 Tax=Sphingomonas sp. R647 TaxID=2875233 RepID=UPI001CD78DF7|nr:GGDEF domain-containing phosphodiesterase [Sphingomonas sp. R647]MCA1197224.1 GGDEF domain-containing phosphodiesterase [Sphingomonas sp. R647]